jgi:hypothetical protein
MAQQRVSEMAKAPTFKSLKAAAEAGYHGKSVNIEGKGLQKVAFADKEYDKKMAARSAAAGKKDSVPVPPPRPERGMPIAEMKPSSTKTQRTMSMRSRNKITETKLPEDKKSSGRGDGANEAITRRMQAAIDRAADKAPKDYTYSQWKDMTPAERRKAGLPVSVIGGELGFKRFRSGLTGRDYTMTGK